MQIESYRTRLEEFEQSLNRELFRYHSGLKSRLELVTLYADHSDLFCTESIGEIKSALKTETFESRRKSLEKILAFLIDQHFDFRSAPVHEELAQFQANRKVVWEGKEVSSHQVFASLRSESDALKRRKLHEKHVRMQEEFAELKKRKVTQLLSAATALGFKDYIEARERISGIHYEKLLNSFEGVLTRLEDKYLESFRISLEATLGIPMQEAGSWDIGHWEQRNDRPEIFARENLQSAVESTIAELNIRPEQADSVILDLEPRQSKLTSAVCIPIRIPHEIKVVTMPGDGARHYAALLHEVGHAHHFAWTSASLPPEHRIIGDRALTEGYGFLIENLLQERDWLARMLGFSKSEKFLRFQGLYRVFVIRRCVGRLRFALKLYGQRAFDEVPQIYSEIMSSYAGLQYMPEAWQGDLDDEFTCADYLRGWAFEAMLRDHLRTKYGKAWEMSRPASGFLKEIWETGLLYRAEELSREIGIGEIEPQILADQLWEGLKL